MKTVYVNKDYDVKIILASGMIFNGIVYGKTLIVEWGDTVRMFTSIRQCVDFLSTAIGSMRCGEFDIMQAKLTLAWNK